MKYLVVIVICVGLVVFQNCTNSSQFSISDSERAYFESTSEKTIEFDVKDRASAPNNLKIAFFLDESVSMNAVKDRVSSGLESLGKRITGLKAAVRFYGVSQTDFEYANIDINNLTAQQFVGAKQLFKTTADKTEIVGSNFTTHLLNQYKNIQPVTVSAEKGRVALTRVLANDSDQAFFKPGDVGIAVVISDEDDSVETETSYVNSAFKFNGSLALVQKLRFEFIATNIGFQYWSNATDGNLSGRFLKGGSVNLDPSKFRCPSGTLASNDPAIIAQIKQYYVNNPEIANNIYNVTNCNNSSIVGVEYPESDFTFTSSSIPQVFGCEMTNFKYQTSSIVYKSLTDFRNRLMWTEPNINSPCRIVPPVGPTGSFDIRSAFVRDTSSVKSLKLVMSEQTGTSVVNDYILRRSQQILGENKFYFSALVHNKADDQDCPLYQEQKVGSGYLALAGLLKGSVHSICSPTYADVMDELSQFISKEIDGYYIKAGRRINQVTLKKSDGSETQLQSNVDYRFDGEFFALISELAQAGDRIIIKYQ